MRKKIAFIVAGVNAGGTENYLLRFLRYYRDQIEATVYCKSGKLGELEVEYRAIGVQLIPFQIGPLNILRLLRFKIKVGREKYDSICDLTGSFAALPLLMARIAGVPRRIGFFRNSAEKFQKTYLKLKYNHFITWLLPKVATRILSNSKTALNHFYGDIWLNNPKFKIIYNGLDAQDFLGKGYSLRAELSIPSNAFVVGHVGRYNEQKNHETAMKVAVVLCKEHSDVYFIFCGKGVDVTYHNLIKENGLEAQIKLLGVRRDISSVLRTMDCFYFPSTIEGQPNALIEALMAGLPFVASNIDPIKETIPEDYYEQLVPPRDVRLAAKKILEIKQDKKKRSQLNLSRWAVNYYRPEKWFSLFYEEL